MAGRRPTYPPASSRDAGEELRRLLAAERRGPESVRRSIEVDVVLGRSAIDATLALGRFCAARGIDQHHRLVATLLAGDATAVQEAASAYEAAGATDLLLGFADFPATDMLEAFAATVHSRAACSSRRGEESEGCRELR